MKNALIAPALAFAVINLVSAPVLAGPVEHLHVETSQIEDSVQANEQKEPNNYPRISHIEQVLTGETFNGEKIKDRLARLEDIAFGEPSREKDLCIRTDRLENYIKENLDALTLNEVTAQEAKLAIEQAEAAMEEPKRRKINKKVLIAAVLITLVLGAIVMSGGAAAPAAMGMGSAGMGMASPMSMGMGSAGMGMAGPMSMGMGMGMPAGMPSGIPSGMPGGMLSTLGPMMLSAGMSSMRMLGTVMQGMNFAKAAKGNSFARGFAKDNLAPQFNQKLSTDIKLLNPPPFPTQERAANMLADTPQMVPSDRASGGLPAASAVQNSTLITKVRWCELQIFGKTFDDMRMVDRLSQLSKQLVAESDTTAKFKTSIDNTFNTIRSYQEPASPTVPAR